VRFAVFLHLRKSFEGARNQRPAFRLIRRLRRTLIVLVERGVQIVDIEVVGDAYAIASNYLRRSGALPDTFATNERLLGIIVKMFQHGEMNRIRLANKAIAKFEAETLIA
jgi:hypothetical protein